MSYYNETIAEIEKLIQEKKESEALLKINVELSMPYIPNDIEIQLINLKKEVHSAINLKTEKSQSIDPKYLFELLSSSDKEQQIIATNFLSKINLREYLKEIKEILNFIQLENSIKTLIIYNLKLQEINQSLEFIFNQEKIIINPSKVEFEEDFEFINEIDKLIYNSVENENPGIAHDAKFLNINYYLNNFPIFKRENANEKAAALILLSIEMLEGEKQVSYVKKWFNYNEEICKQILMELKQNV
ncbi:hypothetical protein EELLY_v1c00410 [Entomoplasma ellychniae]|uniref:Uncharacterized protein n=1 Tax=Entomoplasma ellychniae TaxID=2114 RepID=A0A8E2UCG5_9MOLU|nr:hypothetical protein [Entomoplasma ellychniae]PPE04367.1 hypothetical protein EELLY_v1c00410 [Entomoplasma ellychniae]